MSVAIPAPLRFVRSSLAALAVLAAAAPAWAHGDAPDGAGLDFTRAPADTLPWGYLAKVGVRTVDGRYVPEFLAPLRALDGKRVTLYGFATAVDRNTTRSRYLLTPRPIHCPGCEQPLGPQGIVEVNLKRPMGAEPAHPVAFRGTLHLLQSDPKNVLYRVTDAVVVPHRAPATRRSLPG